MILHCSIINKYCDTYSRAHYRVQNKVIYSTKCRETKSKIPYSDVQSNREYSSPAALRSEV